MTPALHLRHKICLFFAVGLGFSTLLAPSGYAQQADFGINLSGGKEPVELKADDLEMRDKEGIAIFSGNVSVTQGDRVLRTAKLVVHYAKSPAAQTAPAKTSSATNSPTGDTTASIATDAKPQAKQPAPTAIGGLGSTGVEKMEATGKVYVKTATQVATGDQGIFDNQTNTMVLTGKRVILTDGNNVATGCKLTAHMKTGKANLESCQTGGNKKGRVSIIMNNN